MKKLFFICMAFIMLYSCQTTKEQPKYMVVKGQLSNTKGGPLNFVNLSGFQKTINIKDDGSFIDTLYVDEGIYTATIGKDIMSMYLTNGAVVGLTADANNIANTLAYSGDNMAINNYYAYKSKSSNEIMTNMQSYFVKDEASFLQFLDSTKASFQAELNKVADLPQGINQKELRDIDYYIQDQLSTYIDYYPYFSKNENFEVSDVFKARLRHLDMMQLEDYLYSSSYNRMVFVSILRNASKLTAQDSISKTDVELKLASEIANDTMSELLMARFAEMRLSLMKDGKKEYYNKYLSLSKFPEQQQKIKNLYASMQKLESGNPSPKFVNYENYTGGTTSMDDFKGKYVYIDVWATWCGPCKAEIPYLKEIEEKYHGKNIEFVSISVDNDKDHQKWKDMIAEKKMGGIQLFADSAFNSQFIKDYEILGIPRFILLDPDGKIIKSQAPRPSEKELIALFEDLNI